MAERKGNQGIVLSFVVPVYNTEACLEKCIGSLCAQKCRQMEILLVDDGSTDRSPDICDESANQDARIKVIHQRNQGVSAARNAGLACAAGDWVCFVDSDDYMDACFSEHIIPYLNTEYDIVYFGYRDTKQEQIREHKEERFQTRELGKTDFAKIRKIVFNSKTPDKNYDLYSNMMFTAPWGKCYNREFLKRIGAAFIPGIKRAQDGLFNVYVYKYAQKGLFVTEIFYNYRVLPNSATHGYHPDAFDTAEKLIACYRDYLELPLHNSCPELDIMITRQFMYCIILNYCHKKNKKSYRERKKDFLSDLNTDLFREPVQNADIKKLCTQEYVIAILMRHRCFALINLLNKARTL